MPSSLTLGIDPAKEKFTASVLPPGGQAESGRDYPMTREGLERLGSALDERLAPGQRLVVGVEASAALDDNLLLWLCEQRQRWSLKILRLDPGQVARFSGAKPIRGKTDKADARRIAQFTATYGEQLDSFEDDPELLAMERLVRERNGLVEQTTATKNQLQDRLVICWPEFTQVFEDPCAALARTVLRAAPTAAHLQRKRVATLARIKPPTARSRELGQARAEQLHQLAGASIASATGSDDAQALLFLLDHLELIEQRIATIDSRLIELRDELRQAPQEGKTRIAHQIDQIEAMRGIGATGAASFVLLAHGLGRYPTPKALAAQMGTCPERFQTGKTTEKGRLTRRGDRHGRAMLYMMTKTMIWFDPGLAFHKWLLIQRGLKPKQAECACMNRLTRILWAVGNGTEPYDPKRTIINSQRHHATEFAEFVDKTRDNRKLWKNCEEFLS